MDGWEHLHGDRTLLPDSKTGLRTIWPTSAAQAILDTLTRRNGCPWMFASDDRKPATIVKPWQVIVISSALPRVAQRWCPRTVVSSRKLRAPLAETRSVRPGTASSRTSKCRSRGRTARTRRAKVERVGLLMAAARLSRRAAGA